MAIDLDSGAGLFDRLGKLKFLLNTINTNIGSTSSGWPKELNDALVEYDGGTNAERAAVENLLNNLEEAQQGANGLKNGIRTAAQNTLIAMANADDPLSSLTVAAALTVLIDQMKDAGETVDASEPSIAYTTRGERTGAITGITQANPAVVTSNGHGLADGDIVTITAVAGMTEVNGLKFVADVVDANDFRLVGINSSGYTAYSSGGLWHANYGNGPIALSVKDGSGKSLENVLAEDILVGCDNSDTSGSETFLAVGEVAVTDKLSHLWPAGSGASISLSAINGATNLLANGDFETFTTTNTPDDWTLDTGAATTDFLEENTNYLRGTSSLEMDGDGSTLLAISQTLTGLESRTPYAFNINTMIDSTPAAGVLQVDLYDGSAVINDDEGTANSFTIDLTAEQTFFRSTTAFFRLPEPLPDTVKLRIHMTTALSNTSSVFIDEVALVEATRLYADSGPYAAVFAGASDFAVGDEFRIAVTNGREGALQEMFDVFFDTSVLGVKLPSVTGGSETIADTLIA